jgi:hypothetical protein
MTTPSDTLADQIASLLVEGKLFLPEDAQKYKSKIAAGTMRTEDWFLAIEKALDKVGAK